jgi:hypothetical protein
MMKLATPLLKVGVDRPTIADELKAVNPNDSSTDTYSAGGKGGPPGGGESEAGEEHRRDHAIVPPNQRTKRR